VKRGAIVALAAGAAAVVVVVALGAWWFSSRPQTPDSAAREYLRALAAGDVAAIEAMLAAPLDDETAVAFASADGYLSEPRVVDVDEGASGEATVRADAELDGERRDLSFVLTSSGGRWMLSPESLPAVNVEATLGGAPGGGDSAWIGDALVPAGDGVVLLPAVYAVEAAPRGILSGTATIAVTGGAETVALDTALTPEATALAQEQLDAYLDACAAPATAVPAHCGIRVPWAAELTSLESITFRVEEHPQLALSAGGTGFDATGGVIVATASGTSRAGGAGSFMYRAEDWAVRGTVEFTGDEMVLSVR
jgi:hypothetical protein